MLLRIVDWVEVMGAPAVMVSLMTEILACHIRRSVHDKSLVSDLVVDEINLAGHTSWFRRFQSCMSRGPIVSDEKGV